ncbi:MAG: HlyC/CorC family transporter [Gammaproteobacteria bacterium]
MDDIPLSVLIGALVLLIFVSGFFSGSETGLMSLNRYRLRHLADSKHKGALRALRLLEKPEKLIGLILLGNNFVNILAASLATIIGFRLWGEAGVLAAPFFLTAIILIFAEVTPKTIAAIHPERFALPSSFILEPLLKLFYPFVWLVNLATQGLFKILRIPLEQTASALSSEELRIVVNEASTMIPQRHQQMLLGILDLEKVTVEDIMIPRNEITGIDLEDDWIDIVKQLTETQHTRLPVFEGDIDQVRGMIHMRDVVQFFKQAESDIDGLKTLMRDIYYVPVSTPLNTQLLNFQRERRRNALVVNEYGDIQGLITLDDILEEIVGEFTSDPSDLNRDIHIQEDGSYLVDGSTTLRDLNKIMNWDLPVEGPKTLNGLIIEYLEHIPEQGTSMLLNNEYPIEIVQTTQNAVKTVHIDPNWQKPDNVDNN